MATQEKIAPGLKKPKKYTNSDKEKKLNRTYQEHNKLVKDKRPEVIQRLFEHASEVELQAVNQDNEHMVMEMYNIKLKHNQLFTQAYAVYYYEHDSKPHVKITIHLPLL
nr:MAG: hypothetical protein [Microvirus sp.]